MQIKSKNWPLLTFLLVFACPVFAELGGDAVSVSHDRVSMKASSRTVAAQRYTVEEIQTPEGTAVREYLSPAGKVFAIAWNGPYMPDLQQLFGSYFVAYQEAAKIERSGRGSLQINRPELVVQSGGHMRAFYGLAYVPQLVPDNVSIEEIK
jgi:hypothetical protein